MGANCTWVLHALNGQCDCALIFSASRAFKTVFFNSINQLWMSQKFKSIHTVGSQSSWTPSLLQRLEKKIRGYLRKKKSNSFHRMRSSADCLRLSGGRSLLTACHREKIPAAGRRLPSVCSLWSSNHRGYCEFWVHTGRQSHCRLRALQTVYTEEMKAARTSGGKHQPAGYALPNTVFILENLFSPC